MGHWAIFRIFNIIKSKGRFVKGKLGVVGAYCDKIFRGGMVE